MERHEPHYLRKIIEEENLTKYVSKAGVTSFQNSVVKTYMKGVNESQLAKKYEVTPNAIHEAIYGYVVACRRYLGKRTNSRKLPWIDRVEPENDFLEDVLNGKNKSKGAVEEALVEATRVAVSKSLNLAKIDKKNKDKYKSVVKQLRTVLDISMHLLEDIEDKIEVIE